MRKKLLCGNWKMNKTPLEAKQFALDSIAPIEHAVKNNIDVGIAPTYLCLDALKTNASSSLIVFAQNVHYLESGAYTGEVSASMLSSINVDGALIGHSERRTYDNETSSKCNLKIKALLNKNLIPLYCVGETEKEFVDGITYQVIENQLVEGLKDLSKEQMEKVIIAYEPVWSIGTGKNASQEIAENVCAFIRKKVEELYPSTSENVRILYGGSVKPNNIKGYLSQENVDGALVGGASLTVQSFSEMIDALLS